MKPLLKTVVALCLVLSVRAHPENIEDIKELPQSKEPLIEAEESKAVVREERCTTCGVSGNLKLNLKSPNKVLAALQLPPGAEVHTQESFESCTSEKGCAGLKVKDGRVVERFGNQDAFKAAAAADTGNEFSFHAAGNFAGGETPFWWMNQNSPFKTTGAGGGSFEKFSKSSSSFSSTGNVGPSGGAAIGGSVDLSANPFLNGEFSKLAGSFANGAAGSEAALGGGLIAGGKPSGFQSSSFESSSFSSSNKGELDLSKNPFLNGAGFGQSGFQAQAGFGAGGQGQSQGFSGSNSQFGSSQFSGSGHGHGHHGHHGHGTQGVGIQAGFSTGGSQSAFSSGNKLNGYTGSSPSPFTASTSGSNVNLIQNTQKVSEFEFDQQQQTQQNIDEAFQGTGNVVGHEHSGGELQQTCAGQGYVCVHKAQCNNGVVNMNGAGILQAKTKKQYCNTRTEICCRIEISTLSGAGSLQGSLGVGSATFSGSGSQGSGLFSSTSQGANFGSSGNNQGSFGAQGGSTGSSGSFGSSTFESSSSFNGNRGSSFGNGQNGQNAQGSFGTNAGSAQGSFGASTGSATFGVNTGSTTGSSNSFGSTTGSRGTFGSTTGSSGTSGFGSNTGFGISGSFGSGSNRGVTTVESTGFESSSSSSRDSNSFGASNGNKFGVSGTFGANGFGVTAGPSTTRFGTTGGANTNSVYKTTSQSNFIETDSFSAGSENNGVYRPGSNLKPGIPYLPPVDASISGTNVVNTVYSTQRPTTTRQPYFPSSTAAPGYLPPESESRVTLNKVPPPTYTDGELILDQNREGPRRPVQPVVNEIPAGCAAALKCTPIEYCTAEGVISNTTVVLTRDQESYRVPLTDCKDLESGRVGKCCRDPNYHDPWPTNQLGKWVPGVFGGNDGKYIAGPTTKSPAVTGSVLLNNFRQSPTTPGYNQVTSGYNTVTQKNQYEVRGQGQYTKGGQGQYTIGGGGQIGVGGQGGLQDQFTQNTQTVNQFGQKVTQGGGQLVSQGGGQLITQGGGQLIKQGGGQYTQGGGGQYTQGGGQIVTQGGGLQITQGGGQLVTQGSGQLIKQGGGQYTQGGGQIVTSGGGQLIKQGGGQYVTQGSGQIVKQGSGQLVSQGGGQLVSQGGGQLVSQGSGQLVSQGGGQLVTQGGGQLIRQGQGQIVTQGQGQIVKQGQGQYVSQGQGGFLVNQGGFGNEFSESVMRVFLQRYDGNGQCGLLNGQKPYGNRNELEVDFAEIPWQAMVLLQTNRSLLCGGVITRPDVVLTSAACVDGLDAKNVLIKGGEWKLGIDDEPLPFQIVQVKNILRHPFYKRGSLHYDAAILVLSENLRFAKNIYPICLPGADETLDAFYNGAGECIVTGWGKQVLQAHLQGSILHSINVSLINPGECQAKLSQDYPHLLEQYDEDSCACGQPTNPVNNICRVDIGSALACTMGDGHFVLRGLYSWDSGCQPGNQLAAFYKFDLEWYQWAIGLIESARFAQFNAGAGASLTNQRYTGTKSGQYTSGIKGAVNSGVKGGVKGFAKAEAGQGQFQTGFAQSQYSSSKFSEASEGGLANFGAQLNAPLSNSFSATYSAKKVYQSEPQIITYTTKPEIVTFTTKPEIVTFTTKPEYFTYTTKPKYVSYTTKPQIISYETSGSGTNPQPQYAAVPGVTYNPSFSDVVGHTHNAKCKCLEGKK